MIMKMHIARGGWPWILGPLVAGGGLGILAGQAGFAAAATALYGLGAILFAFMLYFFRDPDRVTPDGEARIVAGADGVVRAVEEMPEHTYLKADTVRISVFLSPLNVHVNRAPIAGRVTALAYTPGRHLLTIDNASSEYNEHSSILIEGPETRCLVKQIVGPVVRRVVYWLQEGQDLRKGERIGMMKFGSRLDMYFPAADVEVRVRKGERVQGGVTVVAVARKAPAA